MDVTNVLRFLTRITNGSSDADATMVTSVDDGARALQGVPAGSLDHLAVTTGSSGRAVPPSGRFLEACKSKLGANGWLWLDDYNALSLRSPACWKHKIKNSNHRCRRCLTAAGFPRVSSFAFSERGSTTKSCLWFVPLDTTTSIPCAGPALGIVVPWKQRLAQRPWFWKYCLPNRGYLAMFDTTAPAWLDDIRDRVECYYTTKWRVSVWHRSRGRMAIRDVFFPVDATHDNIRGFWRVFENIPAEQRWRLGLDEYALTDRGDMLWVDRPFLEADFVGPRRQPRPCSHEDVVAFIRKLHETPPLDSSQALSLVDVVSRITRDITAGSQASRHELDRLRALATNVSQGVSGPPVLQHGDMVARNVIATSDGVKAFDWWGGMWVDFPGHDAVSFYYSDRGASGTRAELAHELVRRLADNDPDPSLDRTLRSVRSDIDARAATLTYLLTVLAIGMRDDAGPEGRGGWTSSVVKPALDALQSTAIVRELTARDRSKSAPV